MSTDAFITTKQGISQFERWFEALMPEYVEIDSRDIVDLMRFAIEFASQINYYNQANQLDGTWDDFFIRDCNLLAQMVSRLSINDTIGKFKHYYDAVEVALTRDAQLSALSKLYFYISDLAGRIEELNGHFARVNNPAAIEEIRVNLPDMETELQQLYEFYIEANHHLGVSFGESQKLPDYFSQRNVNNHDHRYFKGGVTNDDLARPLNELVKIFDRINAKYFKLVETAQAYVSNHKIKDQQFAPQMALFMSSLVLYGHLRSKINGLNRKHLDFYYQRLLGITQKGNCADQVHLIIEPSINAEKVLVTPHDLLLAETKDKDPITFILNSELLVTQIRIAELKTIYKGNQTQLTAKNSHQHDIIDTPIYQASHSVCNPSRHLQSPTQQVPWAVMGEDQQLRNENSRTMTDANLGLIIGSPLFYLPEGDRVISLNIDLKEDGYESLVEYVENYNDIVDGELENTIYQLLSKAFKISYTSTEKWEKAINYAVRLNLKKREQRAKQDKKGHGLEFIIQLDETAPSFDLYKKNVHDQQFDSELPLLRIELNNYAQHHPFGFLANVLIDRMTIKVTVKGFHSVKLQNNSGMLNASNPFHIFGVQPAIGSFLDIQNSNLFNCFTKQIALHLEWMDLPRDKGGFSTYFRGYGESFANDSYLVGISALNNGAYTPQVEKQQKIKLFTMHSQSNTLSMRTNIDQIDISNIRFLNRPRLGTDNESTFTQGVLRIELQSPEEAFGQRIFPKIFPEIVMNNARVFGHKEPLPNQPIIPTLKSIKVDYTLEYSESFLEENYQKERNIELIHVYPFGYEQVFPENRKKNIPLMPVIDAQKNLMIGLENSFASAELNLYFELEDCGFQHTQYKAEKIQWSYLQNNTWVNIAQRDQIFDTTKNLICSGIVKLRLPDILPKGNTILNPNLFWLRASSRNVHGISSRVLGIYNNGATAIRAKNSTQDNSQDLFLKSASIKGFQHTISGIQQIYQPYASFNGKPSENKEKYYRRVSERLRHKDRPVLFNDIIQMVLEEFDEIMIVKCFNTFADQFMVLPNTDLQLVLIPQERLQKGKRDDQPRVSLSLLNRVKQFLEARISPFITIEVGNPIYEKIKIVCKVMLSREASLNSGYYLSQLNAEINRFIAPWMYGEQEEAKIGSSLYKSDILLFIKKRSYVEYVSGFSVVHFTMIKSEHSEYYQAEVTDSALNSSDIIQGGSPASVFIPSSEHIITLINEPEFETNKASGIGRLMIGEELLIASDNKKVTIPYKNNSEDEEDENFFSLIITKTI